MKGFLSFLIIVLISVSAYSLEFDSNVSNDIRNQIRGDLSFAYGVQLSSQTPLHRQIFGSFGNSSLKNFFESRITNVSFENDSNLPYVACVRTDEPHKMLFTPKYIEQGTPQIGRLYILFHEARHSEGANGFWMHSICPTPFLDKNGDDILAGDGAFLAGGMYCDSSELGAYAAGGIFAKNISKYCTNCNEKVKMDADFYAAQSVDRVIDSRAKEKLEADYKR